MAKRKGNHKKPKQEKQKPAIAGSVAELATTTRKPARKP